MTPAILSKRHQLTQDQLRQALASSGVGTWLWDLKDDRVYADEHFAHLFGLDETMLKGGMAPQSLTQSVHPGDRARVSRETARAVKNRGNFESEYRTIDAEGEVHWIIARGRIELDGAGEPKTFLGVAVEITARKNAENSLNFLTRATVQFSASLDYKKTVANIASLAVPHLADWCTVDMLNEAGDIERVATLHADPKKVAWAKRLYAKQGKVDRNAPTGVPHVIRTGKAEIYPVITDEMLAAGAKDEKELELLRSLNFHSLIIAPMIIDGESIGAITLVSTESRMHYKPADMEVAQGLANRAALAVYNANLYQAAQQELEERQWLQEQLEMANDILESRIKERTRQLETTNKGLEKEITKRKRAEATLRKYNANLERSKAIEAQRLRELVELNRTKDEFISIASHQLRTPATGVKQYIGMLLEGFVGELQSDQRAMLEKAYESNERQLRIVADLLKVAQVDAGKVALQKNRIKLNEFVTDIIREQATTYKTRRQTVIYKPLKPEVTVEADRDSIRMVLENLIDNASKYSEEATSVTVRVTVETNTISIQVIDEGVGIPQEDRKKLFEKFSRISNPLSTKVGGTGLGLYWAKKIVDLHRGTLTYRARHPRGSIFTICLPKKSKL